MFYLLAFASSALGCLLILRSAHLHLRYTADHPGLQPQKFHTELTPRIGGLAIFGGILVAGWFLPIGRDEVGLYWLLMLSLLPAFIGGFAEDVTGLMGPGVRLLLTVITAASAYSLAGVHFVRSDMVWLDHALAFLPFGYAALLFAVAGVAHGINIIDGYNGLASGFAVIALATLGCVAQEFGDRFVCTLCYATACATLGFMLFNYPRGRLFLGDGGAYLLGCIIALAAAMLVLRNPKVSPWFPLTLVIYPVWETVFSIIRRLLLHGTDVGAPDARHLHSLVYGRISRRWMRAGDQALGNSLTALPFWIACSVMAALSSLGVQYTRVQQLLAVLFIVGYCVAYWRLARKAVAPSAVPSHSPESRTLGS